MAALQEAWEEKYRESPLKNRVDDIYIKNTRVIKVRGGRDFPLLNDAVCVVEFMILSDFFGSQGRYFQNAGILDTVIFYRDGHTEVPETNVFRVYTTQTYEDASSIVEGVTELDAQDNRKLTIG